MNKFTLALTLAISTALLAGCGGGSSNSGSGSTGGASAGGGSTGGGSTGGGSTGGGSTGGGSTGGGSTGGGSTGGGSTGGGATSGAAPVASLTCTDSINLGGLNVKYESGNEGKIEFDCHFPTAQNTTGQQYSLSAGAPSPLVIENIQKKTYSNFSCTTGEHVSGTTSYNYQTGVVVESYTSNAGTFGCTSTFQSPLAVEFTTNASMEKLLDEWGDNTDLRDKASTGLLETTCPQDTGGDNGNISIDYTSCAGTLLENFIITDGDGHIHKLTKKTTYQ